VNLFTAPKRSKGVLRYINEVITHVAEPARKNHPADRTDDRVRNQNEFVSKEATEHGILN
jgi:hypothetical protein